MVAGDVERSVDLAPPGDDSGSTALLTSEVYAVAQESNSGYELTDTTSLGDNVLVEMALEGIPETQDVGLTVTRSGNRWLFFARWEVADGGLAQSTPLAVPSGVETFALNGVETDVESTDFPTYLMLPGTYEFDPYAGSRWFQSEPTELPVCPGYESFPDSTAPEVQPSEEFRTQAQSELDSWLQDCLASTDLEPDGCPQSSYSYGDVRDVTWELTQSPTSNDQNLWMALGRVT